MVKKIKNETKKTKLLKNKKQAKQQETKQPQIVIAQVLLQNQTQAQQQQQNDLTNEVDKNEIVTNEVEYESEVDIDNFIDNEHVIENDIETEDDESFSYVDDWCLNDFDDTNQDDDDNSIEDFIYNKIDWLIDLHQQDVFEIDENDDEVESFCDYIEDDHNTETLSNKEIIKENVNEPDQSSQSSSQNQENASAVQQQNIMELINCKVSSEVPAITNNVIQKLKEFNDKINNMMFDNTTQKIDQEKTTNEENIFSSSQLPTTLHVIQNYRHINIEQILSNIDQDQEQKFSIIQIFKQLGWIDDVAHAIFVAVLHQEWDIAHKMIEWCQDHSITLRKIFGNWERLKDKRKVKELCLAIMKYDEKSMPTLNEWAKQYAFKHCNRIIKSYCDLCVSQDCKAFVMQYSQDL